MATNSLKPTTPQPRNALHQYLPFLAWLFHYKRQDLVGDLMAGVIVAIMLVPQSMAYALLAGLPPQVGLYASILPLMIYGLLGSSRVLAVGPVAIMSLITAAGIGAIAQSPEEYIALALILALLVGITQIAMGVFRLGFLVNFLSHPVISGFTSAAALIIGFSQLKHLMGIEIPRTEQIHETILYAIENIRATNLTTLGLGVGGIVVLVYFKTFLGKQLKKWRVPEAAIMPITKAGPLVIVLVGTLVVWGFTLHNTADVRIVGAIPAGLPPLTLPTFDMARWQALLPTMLTLSFVGFMESISVAKSLASKRRQKINANQELVALGAANLGASFTGGYPVTGGFSRSVVNFTAGANTGLASIVTAVLIAVTVLLLTPLFFFLPQAVLAAIIVVAVATLFDIETLKHTWHYNKADAAALIITFIAVLTQGIEIGILVGVAATIVLFLWRSSRPHVAVVGRLGESETYLNVLRHEVQTWPEVVAVRVDESLYFANTKYLEDTLLGAVAERPDVKHLVLIGTAINYIDASALETLESLVQELRDAGVELHLAAIKGPVMDRLRAIGFVDKVGANHFYLSTHDAMKALGYV